MFCIMTFATRPGTASRFDSLWASFHKFAYLNGASYSDIKALFEIAGFTPSRQYSTLTNLDAFDRAKLAFAFGIPQEYLDHAIPAPYQIGDDATSSSHLRYCHLCIRNGFHTAAFQLKSIQRCPLHNVALDEVCPSCRRSIPYRLATAEVAVPFGCRCGHVLWTDLYSATWPRAISCDQELVFERLEAWVAKFRTNESAERGWLGPGIWMRGLACIEPLSGWRPEHFGASADEVVERTYQGRAAPSDAGVAELPINVTQYEHPDLFWYHAPYTPQSFYSWFEQRYLAIYRRYVRQVLRAVTVVIRSHYRCIKDITVYHDHVHIENDRFCVWAVAFNSWREALRNRGWFPMAAGEYPPTWQHDTVISFSLALATMNVRQEALYPTDSPLVHWLAVRHLQGELLRDFGQRLAIEQEQLARIRSTTDDPLGVMPRLWQPMMAYYPRGPARPARVKTYVGFSFRKMARLTKQGVLCVQLPRSAP